MRIAYKFISNIVQNADGTKRDICIICNHQLFAGTYDKLNDPFECAVRYETDALKNKLFQDRIATEIFSAGIYSLSIPQTGDKFPNNETMWAHYANSHKGFCLAFDLDAFSDKSLPRLDDFDLENCIDIDYQDNSPIIYGGDSTEEVRKKLFAKKSKAWKRENEVRLIF